MVPARKAIQKRSGALSGNNMDRLRRTARGRRRRAILSTARSVSVEATRMASHQPTRPGSVAGTGSRRLRSRAANIITLVAAITAHDRRTRGHSERVRAFNDLIAEEMHLPEQDRERLRWAALLHDVGKIDTPVSILNKPGPLSEGEWREVYRHPENGARITAPIHGWLGPWAAAIEQHHERWDGTGYPNGLAGGKISLGARIVAVADAYDVMTSPRPYRRAMGARAAREELAVGAAGSQFDPAVVRAFLTISLGRLRRIVGPIAWLLQFPILASMSRIEAAAAVLGRQLMITAGTASAVGVLVTSGIIQATPPADAPPVVASDFQASVQRSSAPSGRTIAPPAEARPVAGAAVPTTPAVPASATPPAAPTRSTEPDKGSRPRPKKPLVPRIELRPPPLPAPLPQVELPPVVIPGVDLPPGTPPDHVLNPG